ncbi:pyridoxal-dependent decarboxylase [Dactylosporangium sp. NPDC048998]|uniref:pyridoxal-dependent decarboxylase n=1 Tax=Dactylosporangium sp. NPDC048998 TaxID=3363976 RepID=UPI00371E09A1
MSTRSASTVADAGGARDVVAAQRRLRAIRRRLDDAVRNDLGYPNATDVDLKRLAEFVQRPMNNVGWPGRASRGFRSHTLEEEFEVVQRVADLLRAPADDRTGLVTTGSTAAIRHALLHARDRYRKVVVFASTAAHTCVRKVARHQLRMPFVAVPASPGGEIDYTELAAAVGRRRPGVVPVVVATIGTTMFEAVDDVRQVHLALDAAGVSREARHVHADAALAGLALAGLPPVARPGFDFGDGADSVNISGHKFLGVPEPCGILVIRRSACADADETVTYTGAVDLTMDGSRSGHTPLMLWWALQQFSPDVLHRRAEVSRANARTAVDWLTAAGIPAGRHEHAFTVVLPRPPEPFLDTWPLAVDGDWAHIICMPGKSLDDVHRFVGDYVAVMRPPQLAARPVPIPPTRHPTPKPSPDLAELKDPIAC